MKSIATWTLFFALLLPGMTVTAEAETIEGRWIAERQDHGVWLQLKMRSEGRRGSNFGMTLPVARDLAALGIRVNTIAPGLIDTPIYGEGEASEAFKANLGRSVLFPHRLGTSEEFATLALELVKNSYMNAETIRVDGGIRMPPK